MLIWAVSHIHTKINEIPSYSPILEEGLKNLEPKN